MINRDLKTELGAFLSRHTIIMTKYEQVTTNVELIFDFFKERYHYKRYSSNLMQLLKAPRCGSATKHK